MQTVILGLVGLCCIIVLLALLLHKRKNTVDEILKQNLKPTILTREELQSILRRFYGGEYA